MPVFEWHPRLSIFKTNVVYTIGDDVGGSFFVGRCIY